MIKTLKHISLILMVTLTACKEPIDLKTIDFESALVVEATITDKLKRQKIIISNVTSLESEGVVTENNATVWIEDDVENTFSFSQNDEGYYISDIAFQTIQGRHYQLFITTQDGKAYSSPQIETAPVSQIDSLYPEFEVLDSGEKGIRVFVDSDNQGSDAKYFRYEYEETYKIVPPHYSNYKFVFSNYVPLPGNNAEYDVDIVQRSPDENESVCYATDKSVGIILGATSQLENNVLTRLPIRFIYNDNGIIRDRYSILVKQYVLSEAAHTFYQTVHDLGAMDNILSPAQPGYVSGNISSNNPDEKVLGYFDASTESSKRIFFSYTDFEELDYPPYLHNCTIRQYSSVGEDAIDLYNYVIYGGYQYLSQPMPNLSSYKIVNPECGACTSVGSNIVPDFWEE